MTTLTATVTALQLLGEPTRVRLMALLAREELTVAELVAITDVGQSSVSTHLGRLREAGVLRDRKAGASTFYALNEAAMPQGAGRLWTVMNADLADGVLDGDRARCAKVLAARRAAASWPDAVAGEMERHYSPGRTWESMARGLLGLLRLGDVLDLGCGDGAVAQMLAPRARAVTCLDKSERVLAAARARLGAGGRAKNVRFELGDAQALPFPARAFDEVLALNVLAQVDSPAKVLAEAARVLRPGGLVVVSTLAAHAHDAVTGAYGDVHPGFAPAAVRQLVKRAGFTVDHCDVTSREKRAPHFEIVTAFAHLPHLPEGSRS